MLKIGQNWGKIANCPPQCSTKIGTPASTAGFIALMKNIFWFFRQEKIRDFNNKVKSYGILQEFNKM